MTSNLTPRQWQKIHAYQRDEIARMVRDRAFAEAASHTDFYARVGDWLEPGRGGRVLELGCGPGRFVAMLANLGYEVVGVDPSPFDAWDVVKELPKVELRSGVTAEALPFEDASFDHAACLNALLYFSDPRKALAELRRVLKPHARVIVRNVNSRNLYRRVTGQNIDPAARNHYTVDELTALLTECGFKVRETSMFGFYPPFMSGLWWYLVNGTLSPAMQTVLSNLTPPQMRTSILVFAERDS